MSKTTELTTAWSDPPSLYRSAPFWAWNDRLTPDRLCRQIEQMHQAGMGGFFMHSRYGLKTAYLSEEWFRCVSACVEKARKLQMKAYLYDEDRWPSGAAGGIVTRGKPAFGLHLLVAGKGQPPLGDLERLASFTVAFDATDKVRQYRPLEEGQPPESGQVPVWFVACVSDPSAWYNDGTYLDTLNREAVGEFIRVTHQGYADRYGQDFGNVIPAIFTDEPNYAHGRTRLDGQVAALPWTGDLALQFRKRRGYDIRDRLVELFFPLADEPFSKVRHDYYRTLTELFAENFSEQIGQWCARHDIAMTGHYLSEETLASQIRQVGSTMPHYEHQQWPGIDILCDQIREISTAKQCSSVAAQLARPRVLSELYGCTGWDWPLEGHKFNGGWQYVLGVNFRCPHLSWYSMAGGAKRDYPASIFPHSPWWKYYKVVEDYFARLSLALTQGRAVRDVLMLHPVESAWGQYLPGNDKTVTDLQQPFETLLRLLLEEHYDYDLGDEGLLARHGKVTPAGELVVGEMTYRLVVVPPCATLRATTVALLKRFLGSGGAVVFVGARPERIDGEQSDQLPGLIEQAIRCGAEPQVVASTLEDALPRRVSVTEDGRQARAVWTMLRQVGSGAQLLFLQSVDRQAGHTVLVSCQGRKPVVLWDARTGRRTKLDARTTGGRTEFHLDLPATGSALVSLGMRVASAEPAPPAAAVASSTEAPGPWQVELSEPNVLPLDFCRYRIGDGEFSAPVPVLLADEKVRDHFGLPKRSAGGHQPWYLAETGRFDRSVRGPCELSFAFGVTEVPVRLALAIERPEDFRIVLNGSQVPSQSAGWWVDEDIKTIDLTGAVRNGPNELLLRFDYRSDMELEDLHLLGAFGLRQTGPKRTFDAYTLVAAPTHLAAGSWVGQGLDFYGAAVNYRLVVPEAVRQAVKSGRRVRLSLPKVKCTCAALHVGKETFVLPWPPMSADVTEALSGEPAPEVGVEVIGGRHNSLGPLHVPWLPWTGPGEFDPHHPQWTDPYLLNDHGLAGPPMFDVLE